jgi:agmatinase
VFHHAIQEDLIDPRRMIQVGLRSPYPSYVDNFRDLNGIEVISMATCDINTIHCIAEHIRKVVQDQPCYLSIDVDVLDPAFAPGTGTPEAGGFSTRELMSILRYLYQTKCPNIVGMDIVEVSPAYDQSEITSLAAAQILYDFLHGTAKEPS